MTDLCPVCKSQLNDCQRNPDGRDVTIFSCPTCGDFTLSNTLVANFPSTKKGKNDTHIKISHAIRLIQESNKGVELYTTTVDKILENSLPKSKEQTDTFSWVRPKKA